MLKCSEKSLQTKITTTIGGTDKFLRSSRLYPDPELLVDTSPKHEAFPHLGSKAMQGAALLELALCPVTLSEL